jgi:hypothetical protein
MKLPKKKKPKPKVKYRYSQPIGTLLIEGFDLRPDLSKVSFRILRVVSSVRAECVAHGLLETPRARQVLQDMVKQWRADVKIIGRNGATDASPKSSR